VVILDVGFQVLQEAVPSFHPVKLELVPVENESKTEKENSTKKKKNKRKKIKGKRENPYFPLNSVRILQKKKEKEKKLLNKLQPKKRACYSWLVPVGVELG
jgi:hypothetical protein